MDAVAPVVSALLDPILFIAGHGDSITGNPAPDGRPASDDGGGIGMAPIVGVVVLSVFAVGLLLWLQRDEKQAGAGSSEPKKRTLKLKSVAPGGLIAAVIATPLIIWTASSGGDKETLIVERWTNDAGQPELLVSLTKQDLNKPSLSGGRRAVRLECTGRDGAVVVAATAKWPFIKERGYDYPHLHQTATADQVRRADRCRLRGIKVGLEADVEGGLR